MGTGFLESVYENALVHVLREQGYKVDQQVRMDVEFRGVLVGGFIADLCINDSVVVELKTSKSIAAEHEAQVINYLKASGYSVGLLINFGVQPLQYRRFTRRH